MTCKKRSSFRMGKALGRVSPTAGGEIKYNLFFPATCAAEKTLLRPQTCERSECAAAVCNSFERVYARARVPVGEDDRHSPGFGTALASSGGSGYNEDTTVKGGMAWTGGMTG